jgi:hypothetical protein
VSRQPRRSDDALRARLTPAMAAFCAEQDRAHAITKAACAAYEQALLEAHEAGCSIAAIGRATRETPEIVGRRIALARAMRDAGRPRPLVPLPAVGVVRLRPGGAVHRRWRHGETYGPTTLCGRPVTDRAEDAKAAKVTCAGCRPQPAGLVSVTVQRLPRHMAAVASLRPEVEAARAEARFEQARKARREGRS